jgi:NAD-dependent dihydropyrimidine dehydrogenase PreA subunit
MDLLKIRSLRNLFASRWFPLVPQIVMLVAFCLMIAGGLGIETNDMSFAKVLRNTNLANLLVWSYWWPLMLLSAVLLGRVWCMVCPMELVSAITVKVGLKRQVPNILKSRWGISILYAVVLIVGMYGFGIHRVPNRMAIYLLALFGAVLLTSLIFEKRAFCSYVCPIAHLLGLYSFVSIFKWRANDLSVCAQCNTKDCIAKNNDYNLINRSCTSNLYPAKISDNRDCLLCTQCLKVCPNNNLQFSFRKPFADFFGQTRLQAAEVGFLMLVGAFVVYDILPEWSVTGKILMWLPKTIAGSFETTALTTNLLEGAVLFIVLPALLFLITVLLTKLFSKESFGSIAGAFGLLLIPTVACTHAVKGIFKMVSRVPFFKYALSEPKGVEAAKGIYGKTITVDASILKTLDPIANYIWVVVALAVFAVTLLILRKSAAMQKYNIGAKTVLFLGTLFYWGILALAIVKWRF